jgi:hypothetical protein
MTDTARRYDRASEPRCRSPCSPCRLARCGRSIDDRHCMALTVIPSGPLRVSVLPAVVAAGDLVIVCIAMGRGKVGGAVTEFVTFEFCIHAGLEAVIEILE